MNNFKQDIMLSSVALFPLNATGGVSPNMALGQMPVRPALLIKLVDKDGCFGWGEIWSNFPPRANLHKAHLMEDVVSKHLIGSQFATPQELIDRLRAILSVYFLHIGQREVFEHILAGIDTAAWDLCLRKADVSFAEFMDIPQQAQCYASSLNPGDLSDRLSRHTDLGQTEFKLKIGFEANDDVKFVADAASRLPENSHLMIDSNQSWDVVSAGRILARLEEFDLLFAEEPIRADCPVKEWEKLAIQTNIALAAGENIYGVPHFLEMAEAGVKFLQPDVAKWGGVSGALELAKKMPDNCVLWPHFMGSAVGQQAGLAISAAIGQASKCEMDVNENALRSELCRDALIIEKGCVTLPNVPGLLVPPSEDALNLYGV